MQFFPASYQLFVRTKNMISDKLRSLLLFTGIPVPQQAWKSWKSCICLLTTAATRAGQPGRAMARRRSQQGWAASAVLQKPCWGPSTPVPSCGSGAAGLSVLPLLSLFLPERTGGRNWEEPHRNRQNTCYRACDLIQITHTHVLVHASWGKSPAGSLPTQPLQQGTTFPSRMNHPSNALCQPPALPSLRRRSWHRWACAATQGPSWVWSHQPRAGGTWNPFSAPWALPKHSTNPTSCPEPEDWAHVQPSIQTATAKCRLVSEQGSCGPGEEKLLCLRACQAKCTENF